MKKKSIICHTLPRCQCETSYYYKLNMIHGIKKAISDILKDINTSKGDLTLIPYQQWQIVYLNLFYLLIPILKVGNGARLFAYDFFGYANGYRRRYGNWDRMLITLISDAFILRQSLTGAASDEF